MTRLRHFDLVCRLSYFHCLPFTYQKLSCYLSFFLCANTQVFFFIIRKYNMPMSIEVRIIHCLFATILCLGSVVSFAWIDGQCPCANQSLCQPIQLGPRREKFTFIVSLDNWRSYDYSQLTTIALFVDHLVPEFYCFAHSKQVRLVWTAGYDVKKLGDAAARKEWLQSQVDRVNSTFTDGINIDVEHEIAENSKAAQEFTSLVRELTDLLHAGVPGSQVKFIHFIRFRWSSIAVLIIKTMDLGERGCRMECAV